MTKAILDALGGGSPASYAMRFAAGFENNIMVLSGMSDMAQMEDNISAMKDFRPLSEREMAAIEKVREIFRSKNMIPCTSCRYCTAGCPQEILIPDLFACLNEKRYSTTGTRIITIIRSTPSATARPPTVSPVWQMRTRLSPAPPNPGTAGERGSGIR